jgi:hypothetical protein
MLEKHQPVYKSTFSVPYFASQAMAEQSQMREEILPFTVRIVQDEDDLEKAIQVRHSAYARHLPALAETLREPEPLDRAKGVVIMLAESKLDGTPIGSARLQSNQFQSLAVEQSIDLPDWLEGKSIVEVTRLSVADGRAGRLVKSIMMKAMHQYWLQTKVNYVIATGREFVDRQYEQLLFADIFPGQGFIPLRHVANVPHRVMGFWVETLEQRCADVQHPLHQLFFNTNHPDINLFDQHMGKVMSSLRLISNSRHELLQA